MEQETYIDLKSRIKNQKLQSMDCWASFTAHTLSDKNLDELAAIAELLNKVGVSIEINRYDNGGIGSGYDFVVLKVNKARYKKIMTRDAGRKPDFNKKYDKYGRCTVGELQEKLQTMTKTKISEELGCSRMTLYRIIKNISKLAPEDSMSIWHYTS